MRHHLTYGLSLIAPLAAGIGLIACQFVAGINDELPNSTSATTSTAASTVSSTVASTVESSSTGFAPCPYPDGTAKLACAASSACDAYCTEDLAECGGTYDNKDECCAICASFNFMTATANSPECRQAAAMDNQCKKAAPFSGVELSGTNPVSCGNVANNYSLAGDLICSNYSLPSFATAMNAPVTLLRAAEARFYGCTEAANCICENAANDMTVAADCLKSDCLKACPFN